jgi:alpha-tubulin suppressor-like RCC1 family protein
MPAGAVAVALVSEAESDHSCALLASGGVLCWGNNFNGELGDGSTTNRSTPVAVVGLTGASAVAVCGHSSCAIVSDGSVSCWGENTFGELGDGTTTSHSTPVSVAF